MGRESRTSKTTTRCSAPLFPAGFLSILSHRKASIWRQRRPSKAVQRQKRVRDVLLHLFRGAGSSAGYRADFSWKGHPKSTTFEKFFPEVNATPTARVYRNEHILLHAATFFPRKPPRFCNWAEILTITVDNSRNQCYSDWRTSNVRWVVRKQIAIRRSG